MFNSSVLEVMIGLVFVYLLVSLICTSINEAFSSVINKRGQNLFAGIKNLLNDPGFTGLAQHVYNHGLVSSSAQGSATATRIRLPSYLSSDAFALALMDILGARGAVETLPADLPPAIRTLCQTAAQTEQALAENLKARDPKAVAKPSGQTPGGLPQKDPWVQARDNARAALVGAEQDAANAKWKTALTAYRLHLEAGAVAVELKGCQNLNDPILPAASQALANALAAGRVLVAQGNDALDNIQQGVQTLPPGHTREALLVLIDKTRREAQQGANLVVALRQNVEHWFNGTMDRVGGWYKRWTQVIVYILGSIIVCAMNVDTVNIIQQLAREDAMRGALVAAALDAAKAGGPDRNGKQIEQKAALLTLPVGWSTDPDSPQRFLWDYRGSFDVFSASEAFLSKLLGLVVSVFAVSLGAPFWFDTLSKFINLRGAGTPPGDTRKSSSR